MKKIVRSKSKKISLEETKMEKEYSKGYQRKPEHPADIDPLYKAGLKSFSLSQ